VELSALLVVFYHANADMERVEGLVVAGEVALDDHLVLGRKHRLGAERDGARLEHLVEPRLLFVAEERLEIRLGFERFVAPRDLGECVDVFDSRKVDRRTVEADELGDLAARDALPSVMPSPAERKDELAGWWHGAEGVDPALVQPERRIGRKDGANRSKLSRAKKVGAADVRHHHVGDHRDRVN
jgi:hypothetical protein